MRRGLWLLVLLGIPAARGQELLPSGPGCARAKREMAALLQPAARRAQLRADDLSADTDVLHYLLDIEINLSAAWIGGANTMTVQSRVDGLTLFRFRLDTTFTITDVEVGGVPASWIRVEYPVVEVTLDRPYNVGEQFDLYVAYQGYPQGGGLGAITFRTRYYGAAEVYTLSEPWFAYTWWPAKDDLTDKTTADLWFTVPAGTVAASNGALLGIDDVAGNKRRYRWHTDYPTADYLYCLGATNYHQFGATWQYQDQAMPLSFFLYPEHDYPANRDAWLSVAGPLTTFSDLFGLYPFVAEKYGMLEFGWSGGMEHQTITSIIGYFGWEDGIVHELAHQWWGDYVTCATWHDIWLNEGFATYCEALWYEFRPGGSPADLFTAMLARWPIKMADSVYCYDISDVDRIFSSDYSYKKGAWVLHMLRHVIGDTAFFNALAAYRAAFGGQPATTEDFRQAAETVTGRDLAWFFNEWVYEGGAPKYEWGWQPQVVDGVGYVELHLAQMQDPNWPTFTMPVDVVVYDAEGAHTHTVWNDARTESLLFAVESPAVTGVELDPSPWILTRRKDAVSFVEGPPKIVTMQPAPGTRVPPPAALTLVFHKDVLAQAGDFALFGQRRGAVPFTLAYDHIRHAACLTPTEALPADTYTLTVHDTLVDVAAQLALDGELVKPDGPNPLPSGDGVPGGDAVATFEVIAVGDLNCDGNVDFGDINPFVLYLADFAAWQTTYAGCDPRNGDVNQDGTYPSLDDINPFVALLMGL